MSGPVEHRWSAHDLMSPDELPFIGPLVPFQARIQRRDGILEVGPRRRRSGGGNAQPRADGRPRSETRGVRPEPAQPARAGARTSSRRTPTSARASSRGRLRRQRSTRPRAGRRARRRRRLAPGRRVPRLRRQAPPRLGPMHPSRLHRPLERGRFDLGLPVPRLALRRRRLGAERPGGRPARAGRLSLSASQAAELLADTAVEVAARDLCEAADVVAEADLEPRRPTRGRRRARRRSRDQPPLARLRSAR